MNRNQSRAPESEPLCVSKPGESHSIKVIFQDPWWSVVKEEKGKTSRAGELAALKAGLVGRDFRLEYRPPDRTDLCRSAQGGTDLAWPTGLARVQSLGPGGTNIL